MCPSTRTIAADHLGVFRTGLGGQLPRGSSSRVYRPVRKVLSPDRTFNAAASGRWPLTPDFWLERWQKGDIGFHQSRVHDFLPKYWPQLKVERGAAVFVPLCGKSLDMMWLAGNGYKVIGVELSPLAVDDFFREHDLEAETRSAGPFVVRSSGPFTIWCGDLFELPAEALVDVKAAYDRAALVALPPSLQTRYAETLSSILPAAAPILLASLYYPQGEISGAAVLDAVGPDRGAVRRNACDPARGNARRARAEPEPQIAWRHDARRVGLHSHAQEGLGATPRRRARSGWRRR